MEGKLPTISQQSDECFMMHERFGGIVVLVPIAEGRASHPFAAANDSD